MIIENVKVEIDVRGSIEKYGFSYDFRPGLNIVTGHNSSGKSTIVSCIYYCLGMEQLLGGKRNLTLDKSISSQFEYKKKTFHILNSTAELIISSKDRRVKLKRFIKTLNSDGRDVIYVKEGDNVSSYFLHTAGDHEREGGFYRWLTEFLDISLPKIYSETSDQIKTLYIQNIFPCALIEQTKGWSDFFAQMPSFGIKDSKQKLVEFLLDLENLENEFKKDSLLQKEKSLKSQWGKKYEKIKEISEEKGFFLKGVMADINDNTLPFISQSSLSKMSEIRKWMTIEEEISSTEKKILLAAIEEKELNKIKTPEYIRDAQIKLQSEIVLLTRQFKSVSAKKISEENKVESYISAINKIEVEVERLDSSNRLGYFLSENVQNSFCPVCDHELDVESRLKIHDEKIDFKKSMAFLKSQKKLYSLYVKKHEDFERNISEIISFLANEISLKKNQISNLRKDLSSFDNELSRLNIFNKITLSKKIDDLSSLLNSFKLIKNDLKDIYINFISVKDERKGLNKSDERDAAKIESFNEKFKILLDKEKFNYTSNDINHILIQNKLPSRLLPVVTFGIDTQNIRLSSSASDFIRAQWAFYLTLLDLSKNHPGFLILDEPGQHAMNIESMTALLRNASFTKKQIIMCISKDTKDKSRMANLRNILHDIGEDVLYRYIDIDPDPDAQKCVGPLKKEKV